jgi:hypothetical protein
MPYWPELIRRIQMLIAMLLAAAAPSLEGVPSVSNRFTMGHICPVSPTYAWTAAHVIDPAPFDKDVPLLALRWSDRLGNAGEAMALDGVRSDEDLALVTGTFPVVFPVAKAAPVKGDELWISSFDYAFKFKATRGRVTRMVGNMIVIDRNSEGGSSGGCALNAAGEVVGIVAWGVPSEDTSLLVNVTGRPIPEAHK